MILNSSNYYARTSMKIEDFLPQGDWQDAQENPILLCGLSGGRVTGIILKVNAEYVLRQIGLAELPEKTTLRVKGEEFVLTPKRPSQQVVNASLATHITLLPAHLGLFVEQWLHKPREHSPEQDLQLALQEMLLKYEGTFRYRLGNVPLLLAKPENWDEAHGFPQVGEGTRPGPQMSVVLTAEVQGITEFDRTLFSLFHEKEKALLREKGLDYTQPTAGRRLHATILVGNPPGGLPVSTLAQFQEFMVQPLDLSSSELR